MSIGPPTRNTSRRTRKREITPKEVTKQLQQFEQEKNKFAKEFKQETVALSNNEMLNAYKESPLQAKITIFIDRYNKQEIDKLEKLEKDFKKEIVAISTNDKLKKEDKQQKLTDLKSNYQEMIQQLKDAMESQPYRNFEPYTFVYYYHYHKKGKLMDELIKKKSDIAEIQLLIEAEKERGKGTAYPAAAAPHL